MKAALAKAESQYARLQQALKNQGGLYLRLKGKAEINQNKQSSIILRLIRSRLENHTKVSKASESKTTALG